MLLIDEANNSKDIGNGKWKLTSGLRKKLLFLIQYRLKVFKRWNIRYEIVGQSYEPPIICGRFLIN